MGWEYFPYGKDQVEVPGIEIEGESFHTMDDILIALGKALIKKGVITKAELLAALD